MMCEYEVYKWVVIVVVVVVVDVSRAVSVITFGRVISVRRCRTRNGVRWLTDRHGTPSGSLS